MSDAPPLHGPAFESDPHPAYRWLREHAPVHRVDLPGDAWAWLVTRHDDARRVLADPDMLKDPEAGDAVGGGFLRGISGNSPLHVGDDNSRNMPRKGTSPQ